MVKVPQRASARPLVPVVGWTAGVDDLMVGIDGLGGLCVSSQANRASRMGMSWYR